MIDREVERLRRLREAALRVRAVVNAFIERERHSNPGNRGDQVLFQRGCGAAWRVARTVTGRLRAHPNARYQKDAGIGMLIRNSLAAQATCLGAATARQAMVEFARQLQALLRELEDVRAVTWAADLSDTLGRSQREIRSLVMAVDCQTRDCGGRVPVAAVQTVQSTNDGTPHVTAAKSARGVSLGSKPARDAATVEGDWPFLTI